MSACTTIFPVVASAVTGKLLAKTIVPAVESYLSNSAVSALFSAAEFGVQPDGCGVV